MDSFLDKIAFVVPVYNPPMEFFRLCLESLKNQTSGNYEVILVDDGSSNGAEDLCREYADANDRFHVIRKENGGVASARNAGMQAARDCKWISFIDNDDRIREDTVEYLTTYLKDKNSDVIYFGSVRVENGNESVHVPLSYQESDSLYEEEKREILLDLVAEGYRKVNLHEGFLAVWSKVFRLDFLRENGICFDEKLTIADDVTFVMESILKEKRGVAFVKEPLYIRQVDSTSDSHRYHPEIVENDGYFLDHLRRILAGRSDEEIVWAMRKRYVICLIGLIRYDICHKDNPKPFSEKVRDLRELAVRNPYRKGLEKCELKYFSKKNRLKILLLRLKMYRTFMILEEAKNKARR
ncbi:MAG: glycosyltransferase family 2 protein [Lachnospiraceae bacterium]|nr:glycosyltransferase family 2 protein [Lachnospiraceae bacterium]